MADSKTNKWILANVPRDGAWLTLPEGYAGAAQSLAGDEKNNLVFKDGRVRIRSVARPMTQAQAKQARDERMRRL